MMLVYIYHIQHMWIHLLFYDAEVNPHHRYQSKCTLLDIIKGLDIVGYFLVDMWMLCQHLFPHVRYFPKIKFKLNENRYVSRMQHFPFLTLSTTASHSFHIQWTRKYLSFTYNLLCQKIQRLMLYCSFSIFYTCWCHHNKCYRGNWFT